MQTQPWCRVGVMMALLVTKSVYGWWWTGHALIAEWAAVHVLPEAQRKVQALLHVSYSRSARDAMIAASSWADAVKITSPQDASLHFIDMPLRLGGGDSICSSICSKQVYRIDRLYRHHTIVSAIESALKTLESHRSRCEKGRALRYLIHLVGDIHQPLHVVDPQYQKQRRWQRSYGGNTLYFKENKMPCVPVIHLSDRSSCRAVRSVHAYWDATAGLWPQWSFHQGSMIHPYQRIKWFVEQNFIHNFQPITLSMQRQSEDPYPAHWVIEGVREVCEILNQQNDHYAMNVHDLQHSLMKRINLAGLRLAHYLNALYDPNQALLSYVRYLKSLKYRQDIPMLSDWVDSGRCV